MNPIQAWRAYRAWGRLQRAWKGYHMSKEPVMLAELVKAGAVLLALFGLNLTAEQVGAIAIVAGLIAGLVARARVSPVR